jgi:hypothetical protein
MVSFNTVHLPGSNQSNSYRPRLCVDYDHDHGFYAYWREDDYCSCSLMGAFIEFVTTNFEKNLIEKIQLAGR